MQNFRGVNRRLVSPHYTLGTPSAYRSLVQLRSIRFAAWRWFRRHQEHSLLVEPSPWFLDSLLHPVASALHHNPIPCTLLQNIHPNKLATRVIETKIECGRAVDWNASRSRFRAADRVPARDSQSGGTRKAERGQRHLAGFGRERLVHETRCEVGIADQVCRRCTSRPCRGKTQHHPNGV